MSARIVTFSNDDGKLVSYERYSARLPAFLDTFNPRDGYRVEIERTDLLALQRGRLSLMREAVIAGKKPSEVGLPGIENDVNILVCTAKLLDAQKRVVRNVSAAMALREQNDFRTLETAASQRLVAALGFLGHVPEAFVAVENDALYKRYAARIPEFLKAYNPKDGYCVEISWTDLLSLQGGRLSLLREAIIAGKAPVDVGLPGIDSDVNTLVCTARLLDPQEQVVRSGSASMQVLEHKHFEKLETAACQRLLAALGFGGEVFNDDEDADLLAQGRTPLPSTSVPVQSPKADAGKASTPPLSFEEPSIDASRAAASDDQQEATAAERKLIENLARRVGAPMPVIQTRADVKAARKSLHTQDRQLRGANARSADTGANA